MIDPVDILGPQGRIAARLANYEQRPRQLEMAQAVAAAIEGRRHLIVEAGTGVGKSFAYLVPAILAVTAEPPVNDENDESDDRPAAASKIGLQPGPVTSPRRVASGGQTSSREEGSESRTIRRIVISTHTIALQEQLVQKDIPLLQSIMPNEFTAVLVKGRRIVEPAGNCSRRNSPSDLSANFGRV